jgi:disulfide bond formation protein DsbB
MSPLTIIVNQLLAGLTLISQLTLFCLIIGRWLKLKNALRAINYFKTHRLLYTTIVTLTATLGSLFYSEIAGFEPCKLCWFQRIMMYPMALISLKAFIDRDQHAKKYLRLLSLVGISISLYHYCLQLGILPSGSCSIVGASVSCSKVFVMAFGYITIPLMALTAFALIIALQLL